MTGYRVQPEALTAFAQRCENYGDSMDALSKSLIEAQVGRDAFGHIPEVGSKIYDAYDKHVEQCKQAAAAAASSIHSVGANVAITSAHYEHAEHASTVK